VRQARRILRSFRFAGEGIAHLLRTQANFWVHCLAAVVVIVLAVVLGVSAVSAAALALAIGLVLVCEALNTALEAVVDLAAPQYNPLAKTAKDAAAAAVLIAAAIAALVGLLILGPPLLTRLGL
jgi:diacylglycerol kinase (ATP)